MRLWHYRLIPALPRNQLIAQLRECVAIAKGVSENGTPNHILVNKVTKYPKEDFLRYVTMVIDEISKRGYIVGRPTFEHLYNYCGFLQNGDYGDKPPFAYWHNDRYLRQCYYNLEEKHDCGGITDEDFDRILKVCDEVVPKTDD